MKQVGLLFLVVSVLIPQRLPFSFEKSQWIPLQNGLSFCTIKVQRDGKSVDEIATLKIDPAKFRFRVFFDNRNDGKSIDQWQRQTGAVAIWNSSYYSQQWSPIAPTIIDGKLVYTKLNPQMRGMFVAEPSKSGLPQAQIVPLKNGWADFSYRQYDQMIQSFPLLLDAQGKIGVGRTNWRANRTVIAQDKDGMILVFCSKGASTLYDFAQYLKAVNLGIRYALNLDGGYEACLAIQSGAFHYVSYGQWETNNTGDISVPGIHIKLPITIGIFPRGDAK